MNHPNPYALSGPLSVVLAMVVVLAIVGATTVRRGHRRTVARARVAVRTGKVLARVATTGVVITLAQWALLAATTAPWVWGVALGLPALVAGSAVHPLFTVTTTTHTRLSGRARR